MKTIYRHSRSRLARPSRRLSSGFTLIELLVVIAIIALLAAILFPVFAKVREKAHQMACLSNIRQVTLGLIQYSQDNDDRCPNYSDNVPLPNTSYWPQFIAPYVQRQASADFNSASKVFVCPSAPYDAAAITGKGYSSFSSYGLSDNWVDAACPDDCNGPTSVAHAFSEAVAPAETVLLAETMYKTDSQFPGYTLALSSIDGGNRKQVYANCDAAGSPKFSPARKLADLSWRHSTAKAAWCADPPSDARISVAYADGHVKSVTAAALLAFRPWSLMQGAGTSGHYPDTDGQIGSWYP